MNFNFKKLSLAALAAVGLTFGGYAIHYQTRSAVDAREEEKVPVVDFSKYSLAGLMNIIKEPQHGDHMIGAGKEVIARMEKQKLSLSGLAFSKEGKLYALPNDLEEEDFSQLASGSVIAHRDSGLMKLFKKYLGTTTTPLVESNVDWTIFSPNVKIRKTDVGGSSYGEKIVFLDTLEWGAKVPFFDLAVRLTHEAQETPPLLDELNAYEKEVELLSWLLKRTTSKDKKYKLSLSEEEKSYLEERLLPQRERQVARGKYLASFGNNFAGAYPHNTLLADNFLQLRAPQEFLGKYEHIATGNPLDTELTLAVQTALIAYRFNVAHAAEIYEKMLQEGTALKKENARSALNYLFPKGMNQKGSAKGFDGKGILKIPRGDFWDYFISDIKSLFVNEKVPETYADLPEQKVQKYIPQKKREEKQRKDFETHEVRMALTPSELIESELNEK
ncbi:hypothetical protein HYX13_05690, partial [Candidatus Woesearchaeota archaeon]|nr:hypothetical protein [Candidatus Woesearchaeota archaeon]